MRTKPALIVSITVLVVVSELVATSAPAFAEKKENVLYSFCSERGCPDGDQLWGGGVIFDAAGNLYGVTYQGGFRGNGTVFELTPGKNGSWTETVLYSFANGNDGAGPSGGLTFDAAGNLYGTTVGGGSHSAGVVYELTPNGDGAWTETILHTFGEGNDGYEPTSSLVFDSAGNLYG